MTAIYGYAHEQIAFVAGDTLRVDPNGARQRVCKLHHWSDSVVVAQAGEAQFLSNLLQKVLPFSGFFPPTADGFVDAFRQLNKKFWAQAKRAYRKKKATVPDGTVLIAAAAMNGSPARVFRIDFKTGLVDNSPNQVDADGTDVQQFRADAIRNLATLQAGDDDAVIQLDTWASQCVDNAVTSYPKVIGFPMDALIARPSGVGDRILVHRRMMKLPPPHELFRVP